MTDLAMRNTTAVDTYNPVDQAPAGMQRLSDWAREATAAASLAERLCRTPFVPSHFRGKPEDTAAAILTGHELGLSPMAALRSIFIISGTPGLYAKTMQAVVQAQGHEIWVESASDKEVTVCGRRRGSDHVMTTTWTVARCEQAGLFTNAKYRQNPQQMMTARGLAEMSRLVAPDALLGVPYAVEEIADFDDRPVRAEVVPTPRLTAADLIGATPDRQPETAGADESWPVHTDEPMTAAQGRNLTAAFGQLGIDERGEKLERISQILDREVTTSKSLTKGDAMKLIEVLEREAKEEAEAAEARATARTAEPNADAWPTTPEIPGGEA